jgi:hypothetical protein
MVAPAVWRGATRGVRPTGVALLALAACVMLDPTAQRVVDCLVGLDARQLRVCLGDSPYRETRPDTSELWAYTFPAPGGGADIEISRAVGRGTAYARPTVDGGDPTERRNPGEGAKRVVDQTVEAGTCLHVSSVANNTIQSYRGRGRDAAGLNADSICIALLERRLPAKNP